MTATVVAKTSIALALGVALSSAIAKPASALGFSGDYAPANFNLFNLNADGSIDTSDAPNSITITGGNNGSNISGFTAFVTTTQSAGNISFDWSYLTSDSDAAASFDPFGYFLDTNFVLLTNPSLANQNGTVSFNVAPDVTFGFGIFTTDNSLGAASATISNFQVSEVVPTPALLPGLIGMGIAALRKRREEAEEAATEA